MNDVKLHLGDCLEYMRSLPDGAVDAVITDPPYNVGIDYEGIHNDSMSRDEFILWASNWFRECRRVAQTVMITGQARLPDYAVIEPWKWLIAWWKPAAMGRSPVGFCNWEPVAMWGRGASSGVDFVRAPIVPDDTLNDHPCPKPLSWAVGLIDLLPWANTILDPFMGSGTVGVACVMMGKKFIGCEIGPSFYALAQRRIAEAQLQPPLFPREPQAIIETARLPLLEIA